MCVSVDKQKSYSQIPKLCLCLLSANPPHRPVMSSTWMLGLVVVVVGLGCSFVPAANGYIGKQTTGLCTFTNPHFAVCEAYM